MKKAVPIDKSRTLYPNPGWSRGTWKEFHLDKSLKIDRQRLERYPTRTKTFSLERANKLVADYMKEFERDFTLRSLFQVLQLGARYPLSFKPYSSRVMRTMDQFYTPDCYEFTRAAFCFNMKFRPETVDAALANKLFPKFSEDLILTECLVSFYGEWDQGVSKKQWALNTAIALYKENPQGRYFYGNLLISSAVYYAFAKPGKPATEQALSIVDMVLKDKVLSESDTKYITNRTKPLLQKMLLRKG